MLAIEAHFQGTQSHTRFQASLLDQMGNAVVATDLAGKILYWNRSAHVLYQWSVEEVLGKNIYEVVTPAHSRQLVETILSDLVDTGTWKGEVLVQRQDKSQFIADVTFSPFRDAYGNHTGFIGIFTENTERQTTEAALKQSEANLQAIFNSSLQGLVLIDRQQKIQAFNKTANEWIRKIFNKQLKKGDLIHNYICSEYIEDFNCYFNEALKGELVRTEKPFKELNGKLHWFEFNYCPVFGENNEVIGVCQVAIDISRQKTAIDELARSEDRFRSLVQNSSDIIIVLENDGQIRYSSPSVEKLLGYKSENLAGKNFFEYVDPEDLQIVQEKFAEIKNKPGIAILTELRISKVDGSSVYIELAANNHSNEASIKGIVINCRDITERKQAEAVLWQQRERERLMNAIAQNIRNSLKLEEILKTTVAEVREFLQADRVLIYRIQPEWTGTMSLEVESVASTWQPLRERTVPNSCYGENEFDFYKQGNIHVVQDIYTANLSAHRLEYLAQFQVKAKLIVPILQQDGLWGLLIVHQCNQSRQWQQFEIDLLKQLSTQVGIAIQQAQLYEQLSKLNADLEQQVQERTFEMEQKLKELQKLNLLKDDFLSTVSHELRTPLTNMKMAIQMLKIASTPERRNRYIEILQSECNRETDLINDLLDLQRLEVASTPIALETINLQTWLPNVIEPFCSRTQENEQTLILELPELTPPLISDRNSLERVIAELINNACKYTSPGEKMIVGVDYEPHGEAPDGIPLMVFTVSNQAEIPASELPRIFEKFYRVPHADRWKRGGTGLGLALVQKLVERLEGTIRAESSGGWTRFIIKIPVNPSARLLATGHRVLV